MAARYYLQKMLKVFKSGFKDSFDIFFYLPFIKGGYEEEYCVKMALNTINQLKNREDNLFIINNLKIKEIPKEARGGFVLFFSDHLTIIHPWVFPYLKEALKKNKWDVLTVMANEAKNPLQILSPPFPYFNRTTYYEVAKHILELEAAILPISDPDPFFFACRRQVFEDLLEKENFPNLSNFNVGVIKNLFVHRFWRIYGSPREDIQALIPKDAYNILDIGCAEGTLGKKIKEKRDCRVVGVEANKERANIAKRYLDKVFVGKVEEIKIEEKFDVIICADLLEHLERPDLVLKKLKNLLNKSGKLIVSVPNVGHWSIVRDLIEGRWEYLPWGILCISHLRFFTKDGWLKLFKESGFNIEKVISQKLPPTPDGEIFLEKIRKTGLTIEIV